MKKAVILFALLPALCSLTACGQKAETNMTPSEILEAVIDSQSDVPEFVRVTVADTEFDTYLSHYYQLEREQVADGALCYVDGVDASEIAVLVLTDESDTGAAEKSLSAYIKRRAGDFAGYAPQQETLANNGAVMINGKYAALLICSDVSAAKTAFLDCFGETVSAEGASSVRSEAPAAEPKAESAQEGLSFYDSAAILQAWDSGDPRLWERSISAFITPQRMLSTRILPAA